MYNLRYIILMWLYALYSNYTKEGDMQRASTARHHKRRHNNYDIYGDIEKIRAAFANTASDVTGRAGEMLNDSYQSIIDKSSQMQENVADFTAEKPFKSLGIALLAGVVLGLYFTHRRD